MTFAVTDASVECVKICHLSEKILCEERSIQEPSIEVKSLVAFTAYKFHLGECGDELKTLFNEFDIKTQHDGKYLHQFNALHGSQSLKQIGNFSISVPGPITNHKILESNGILLEWEAPVFAYGRLTHYLIEWTVMNNTHAEQAPIRSGRNSFKFPHTKDGDRFNISIRAVNEFGAGIPVYINLHNLVSFPSEKSSDAVVKNHDPRLGIAIGILLSVICVIVCMWIIVRHRQCVKSRQQSEMNGGIVHHQIQNRSINAERIAATTLFSSPPNAITPNCVIDVHEMQTLIVSAAPATDAKLDIKNGKNGGWKSTDNGSNGKYVAVIERDADDNRHSDDEDDNEYECSRRGLISSTPKGQRKSIVIVASSDLSEQNSSTNKKQSTADSTTTELSDDNDASCAVVASSSKTNILTNGSLRNLTEKLPQVHGLHSISMNKNDCWTTAEAASIARPKQNGNAKRHSQPMEMPLDAATVFDNSQKKLLDSTIDSSSSSSSSCSSQNSSSNNRCNFNYKNNSAENIHSDVRPIKYNDLDHNHFHHSVRSIANQRSSSPSDTIETITNGVDESSDDKCTSTEQPSTIDLNEDSYFQKRLQKWDYRRPIVGPNG